MPLTLDQLKALSFGYLQATDLIRWSPPQLLIHQHIIDDNCLDNGCDTAYDEMISKLQNRYDIRAELAKSAPLPSTATAILTGGAVTSATIGLTPNPYAKVPAITFTGGGGAGAAGTAVLDDDGNFTGIIITVGGAAYTSPPSVVVKGKLIDARESLNVKLAAILAVRNILGNSQNVSENMLANFKWAEKELKDIRMQQGNLQLGPVPSPTGTDPVTGLKFPNPEADAGLVNTSFLTLG